MDRRWVLLPLLMGFVLSFGIDGSVPAAEHGGTERGGGTVQESSTLEHGGSTLPEGKSMERFVQEAKGGFKSFFTDEEVMVIMEASKRLKETDRELARKLEAVAAKMTKQYLNLEEKK